jgi:hypothetical protein
MPQPNHSQALLTIVFDAAASRTAQLTAVAKLESDPRSLAKIIYDHPRREIVEAAIELIPPRDLFGISGQGTDRWRFDAIARRLTRYNIRQNDHIEYVQEMLKKRGFSITPSW